VRPTDPPGTRTAPGVGDAGQVAERRPTRSWSASLRAAAIVWSVSYVGYATMTVIMRLTGATDHDGNPASWRQWDAAWYDLIAQHGYLHTGQPSRQGVAFLPLYPMIVRGADALLPGGAPAAAIVVSAAAYLAALTVLHRLVTREVGAPQARRALWCLAAFPTAFFLAVGYNMSLSLLLLTGTVYVLRCGRWWLAGAIGGLATANRTSAVLLLVAFAVEQVRQFGWRPRWQLLAALLVPAGLAGYGTYLWWAFGDPLAFGNAQAYWRRELAWPWTALADAVGYASAAGATFDARFYNLIDVGAVVVLVTTLVLALAGRHRLAADQRVFVALLAALTCVIVSFPAQPPLVPLPLMSAARMALEAFPAFLVLATVVRGVRAAVLAVPAVLLQVLLLWLFMIGKWAG
jgi:mannosyltransferase PIG-V